MQEEEIKGYIDRLNEGKFEETIFLRKINKLVEVARVWEKEPELDNDMNIQNSSYNFFFIKNDSNKYVGAVLDMSKNLYWFVLKQERKKGYLTMALREAIIPYMFYENSCERELLKITIKLDEKNYDNSRKVAERLGFRSIHQNETETEFELKKVDFVWRYENLIKQNGIMSNERYQKLKDRLVLSYLQLKKISDELLMTYNDDKNLGGIAEKIAMSYFNLKVKDSESEK